MAQQAQDPQGFPKLDIKAARALNPHVRTIQIQSILGGHSVMSHFSSKDQFRASVGIDPSLPFGTFSSNPPSGLLVPTAISNSLSSTSISNSPLWLKVEPKSSNLYMYDFQGSVYSGANPGALTGLHDGGELPASKGNGMEYYDNYIYLATNTDISRYGPLNGGPSFTGTYWTGTLGKAALTNTAYPTNPLSGATFNSTYPNHVMHRHSDGKLYIADVSGNQGTIHVISTTKTIVEGDTDNGSTFGKLQFGYGLWPTAIESYGSQLVIALYEGGIGLGARNVPTRAKIAFWDTTSQSFNSITWVEFPDVLVTAIKNINGTLYFFSGINEISNVRVTRYIGGSSFQELYANQVSPSPFAGAVDGESSRLVFSGFTALPESATGVYEIGLRDDVSKGVFVPMRIPSSSSGIPFVTALTLDVPDTITNLRTITAAWTTGGAGGGGFSGVTEQTTVSGNYGQVVPIWWSQVYKIGQPFKVTKIRVPFAQALTANMTVALKLYMDEGVTTYSSGLSINGTAYPAQTNVVLRPQNAAGQHNFWLEFVWTGVDNCAISLPITIEYELIPD